MVKVLTYSNLMNIYWNKVLLFTVCFRMMIALYCKRLLHKRTYVDKYYSYTTRLIIFTYNAD
jgi:hypothetical protein